jgi:hypothetical protein
MRIEDGPSTNLQAWAAGHWELTKSVSMGWEYMGEAPVHTDSAAMSTRNGLYKSRAA